MGFGNWLLGACCFLFVSVVVGICGWWFIVCGWVFTFVSCVVCCVYCGLVLIVLCTFVDWLVWWFACIYRFAGLVFVLFSLFVGLI